MSMAHLTKEHASPSMAATGHDPFTLKSHQPLTNMVKPVAGRTALNAL
jgi:hypothetical protein